MTRTTLLALVFTGGLAAVADAQPFPRPFPQPFPRQPFPQQPFPQQPFPQQPQGPGGVDGQWFFRGDQFQPTFIETVATPDGPALLFTNEKGGQAYGRMSRDGRRVTIPDWNLTGTVRGNALVWPNGDFWGR